MSIFDNIKNSADKGTEASKEYVSKTIEYSKLKAFQVTALTLSMIVKLFVIGSLSVLGFIFLAISSAIALGELLENSALGYLFVGLFFFVISIVIYLSRKSFEKKVISKVSKIFYD
ncbi:hypothetical protein QWY81_15100 [Polaribacter undariae]|uniref:Phage holin family protein n=1 Tax=Polaribacter sejongensis TaxID=985043 RepID=A0AAJ1R044_9FLAO|nr:hypothetical protein [Polaribacter undariae]MDN3620791.1 hypothetical protein [Polaribacter undariae]UWD31390.1 hypothetical protein NQP51_14775 [Polaribacter undariae]